MKKEIYDIPNERSSHTRPTPHGGGLVVVLVSLSAYLVYLQLNNQKIIWAYFVGAFIVGFVSWLDDLYKLSIVWRFLCHSIAAALILFTNGFPQTFSIPLFGTYIFGNFSILFWFLWIVSLINAYNFMDGIDGIAGIQAFSAGLFWAILGWIFGLNGIIYIGSIIATSAIAFLIYNWQPAKIFMGDVGSAFLGYNFAVLPILAFQESTTNSDTFWYIAILFVWLFFFDSAKTLLQRILKRKRFWEAHREHLYQKMVIKGFQHSSVSLIYGILTMVISLFLILSINIGFPFGILIFVTVLFSSIVIFISGREVLSNEKTQ